VGLKSASTSAKWQFVGTVDQGENGGFMLNTDFALFYDLKRFYEIHSIKLGFLRKSILFVLRCTWTGQINLKIFLGNNINYPII
jgi:hypothetical protein